MAASLAAPCAFKCLACGANALENERRVLDNVASSVVVSNLKSFLMKMMESVMKTTPETSVLLDTVIRKNYVCRNCFDKYKTHAQKADRLYNATAQSKDYVVAQLTELMASNSPEPPNEGTRKRHGSSTSRSSSVLPSKRKRCKSPPVYVSCNYH